LIIRNPAFFFVCWRELAGHRIDHDDHIKVIKLLIGGSRSCNNLELFVDSLELNDNVIISAPVTIGDGQRFNTIQDGIDAALAAVPH
jgi:hypothetical protein